MGGQLTPDFHGPTVSFVVVSTLVADAAEQNFAHLPHFFTGFQAAGRESYGPHAGDAATCGTDEVGMRIAPFFVTLNDFEAVDMIAEFRATQQSGVRQIIEVAKCGGLVDPCRLQF